MKRDLELNKFFITFRKASKSQIIYLSFSKKLEEIKLFVYYFF